jgi:hypothetical protein
VAPAEKPTIVEFRTFDGLVVRVTGVKSGDASWITLEASVDAAQAAAAPRRRPLPTARPHRRRRQRTRTPRPRASTQRSAAGATRSRRYQYDQMTRRMSELLKAPPAAARRTRLPSLTASGPPGTLRAAMSTQPKSYPIAASYAPLIARARVYDVAIESPLDRAPRLSARLGHDIYLKREDLQAVFSFKLRGSHNKIAQDRGARSLRTASFAARPATTRKASRSRRASAGCAQSS